VTTPNSSTNNCQPSFTTIDGLQMFSFCLQIGADGPQDSQSRCSSAQVRSHSIDQSARYISWIRLIFQLFQLSCALQPPVTGKSPSCNALTKTLRDHQVTRHAAIGESRSSDYATDFTCRNCMKRADWLQPIAYRCSCYLIDCHTAFRHPSQSRAPGI
jgi:hypothetical protein